MSLLESTPNRTTFRSFLVNQSYVTSLSIDSTNYSNVDKDTNILAFLQQQQEVQLAKLTYTFIIE